MTDTDPTKWPLASTVVLGYVPTPEGIAALKAAKEAVASVGSLARLVVVNTGDHDNYATAMFATAQDLDALSAELRRDGIPHEVRQPTDGRGAAEEIVTAALEVEAGLVVIGLRRRSAVGKLLMGSTAHEVLMTAPCPVLAVKAERRI